MPVSHLPLLPERHGKRVFHILLRIRHKRFLFPQKGVFRERRIHDHIRHQLQSGVQIFRQNLTSHAQGIVTGGRVDGSPDVLQKTGYIRRGTGGCSFQQALGHQVRHPGVMLILRTASGLERHAGIGQRQAMVFTDHHLHAVAKNMLAQGRSRRGGGPFFIPGVAARGVQADFRHIRGRQPGGTNAVQIFRSHPFNSFLPFGRQVQIARAEPVRPHFRGHPGSGTPAAQATDPGLFADSLQVLRKILFRQIAKLLKHQVPHLVALGAVHVHADGKRPFIRLRLVGMHLNAVHQAQAVMELFIKTGGTSASQNAGQSGKGWRIRMGGTGQAPGKVQLGVRHGKLLPHPAGTELVRFMGNGFPVQGTGFQVFHQQFQMGKNLRGIHVPRDGKNHVVRNITAGMVIQHVLPRQAVKGGALTQNGPAAGMLEIQRLHQKLVGHGIGIIRIHGHLPAHDLLLPLHLVFRERGEKYKLRQKIQENLPGLRRAVYIVHGAVHAGVRIPVAAAFLHLAGQFLPGKMRRSLKHQMLQQMGKSAPLPVPLIHGPRAYPVLEGHYGMRLVLLNQNRQTISKTARHRFLG